MRPALLLPVLLVSCALSFAACADDERAASTGPTADAEAPEATADAGTTCAPAPPEPHAPFPDPACPIDKPSAPDAFDEALTKAGLDRCTLGYTKKDWSIFDPSIHDAFRLPWYNAIHDHPMRAPAFGRSLVSRLDEAAGSKFPVTGALAVAAYGLGATTAPCVTPFSVDAAQPLARAVAQVISEAGGTPDDAALEADAADVPLPLQQALARVVLAAGEAQAAWAALAKPLSKADREALALVPGFTLSMVDGAPDVTVSSVSSLLSARFDEVALAQGAVTLALRIESAGLASFVGLRGFDFEQDTPLGRIVVRDGADHVHAKGAHVLLLVDTGGNDTYLYPAGAVDGADNAHHVGLAIDLGGRDTYGYEVVSAPGDAARLPSDGAGRFQSKFPVAEDNGPISLSETMRQGAGRLGYGMLFDLGPEGDTYRSLRMSQGYGAAGVGVLYDAGGNDVYEGEAAVQGSAHFGIGLLVDSSGNDLYRAYSLAQGFSYVRAVGILYDGDGDDKYLSDNGDPADGGDPLYWSVQIPGKANNSFSQGASWGRRSPGSGDDVDMSGGLAILRDRRGNDVYVASTYAQGSGYWFGTGILADGAGNDTYDARYYVQGAGAHFALALFLEDGGDDRYNQVLTPKATSIGVGHDFTVAWHLDLGGNDVYRAPGLSLGSGNANGIGILVNIGGDDVYRAASEPSIGAGNLSSEVHDSASRRAVATTGIFVDVGGRDTYDVVSTVTRGDGTAWTNNREPPDAGLTTEHGAGVDRETGSVSLP